MKEYHFNEYGICVDYDKPIARKGKGWSLEIRTAHRYKERVWVYGYVIQASQPRLYESIPVSFHDKEDLFTGKHEAIRAALFRAKKLFKEAGKEDAVKKVSAIILDYSSEPLFPEDDI